MINPDIEKLQSGKIKQLLGLSGGAIHSKHSKTKIPELTFKAPTGSGKTYMIALFCQSYLKINPSAIFLVSSLSKAGLASQNYEKFEDYRHISGFNLLQNYLVKSDYADEEKPFISSNFNTYFLPTDLFKEKSILFKYRCLENLFDEFKRKGKKIILIKDECHRETKNINTRLSSYFSLILNFSATPDIKKGQNANVQITESEAESVKLIKYKEWMEQSEDIKDTYIDLDKAFEKFEQVKKEYLEHLGINPCMIIQISNKDKGKEELEKIKEVLQKHNKLQYIAIFDKDKDCESNNVIKIKGLPVSKWKDVARENNSEIDIIIFKLTITEGWDIPRACMLFQIRDTKSTCLTEQVIGRVRRNPILLDFDKFTPQEQNLALVSYIWGVKPKDEKWVGVKLKEGAEKIKIKTTVLKDINKNPDFNLDDFKFTSKASPSNIFEIYRNLLKTSSETQNKILSYSDINKAPDYSKYLLYGENCQEIDKQVNSFEQDYEKSMELGNEVSLATVSCFEQTADYLKINNWLYRRRKNINVGVSGDEYSFDSFAEKTFASLLQDISSSFATLDEQKSDGTLDFDDSFNKSFCYAKNFYPNSSVKFEYFNIGKHSSYPDFVVKDKNGKIHLFEVKSVNTSNNQAVDRQEYEQKINALKKAYKYASLLTKQDFYIPLLQEEKWQIYCYSDGNEKTISLNPNNSDELELFKKNFLSRAQV